MTSDNSDLYNQINPEEYRQANQTARLVLAYMRTFQMHNLPVMPGELLPVLDTILNGASLDDCKLAVKQAYKNYLLSDHKTDRDKFNTGFIFSPKMFPSLLGMAKRVEDKKKTPAGPVNQISDEAWNKQAARFKQLMAEWRQKEGI